MSSQPALARRLGLGDAVLIGLGSMIGAGVFAAFAPAAQAAGSGLLVGLAVAAVVAFCNATASAQLAAAYPTSGGTYAYGRARLGPWWGYLAGWSFLVGKTASCAAMAITFAAYAAPPGWEKPVAVVAVLALGGVNALGVTRTALLTRVLVTATLLALAVAVAAGASTGLPALGDVDNASEAALLAGGWYGVLQSAGLLFFAFAGYARIATMGEEVRDPARTIPRAIVLAFSAVVVVYGAVAVVLLGVLGPSELAASSAPVADAVGVSGWSWADPVVRVGAAAASLGALLALIAGVGRTALAMGREGDLPRWLAAVHPRFLVPHRAALALAVVVSVLVLLTDLRGALAFSSFGVLLYYAIANLAAFTQPREQRRYPKGLQVLGLVGCVGLVVTLPVWGVVAGVVVVVVGVLLRVVRLRVGRHSAGA